MVNVNELTKIMDFEVQLRKPYEELTDIVNIANKMLLNGNNCLVNYLSEKHLFRVRIYRCRQSFSSLQFSSVVKEHSNELNRSLTIANMTIANNGFLQFSVRESSYPQKEHSVTGPILHVDIYEPKDPVKAKFLRESLSTI